MEGRSFVKSTPKNRTCFHVTQSSRVLKAKNRIPKPGAISGVFFSTVNHDQYLMIHHTGIDSRSETDTSFCKNQHFLTGITKSTCSPSSGSAGRLSGIGRNFAGCLSTCSPPSGSAGRLSGIGRNFVRLTPDDVRISVDTEDMGKC